MAYEKPSDQVIELALESAKMSLSEEVDEIEVMVGPEWSERRVQGRRFVFVLDATRLVK